MEFNDLIDKIYNMDCLEGMKQIPDNSIDLVVTDPPYGINYVSNHSKNKEYRKKVADTTEWDKNYNLKRDFPFDELWRIMKENSHMYVFTRWDVLSLLPKPKNVIVWWKKDSAGGMGDLNFWGHSFEMIAVYEKGRRKINGSRVNVIPTNCVQNNFHMLHPTMKDIKIILPLLTASSKEGDIILDPFMGSGTTAVACRMLNRHFIGFEISKEYCDIANNRLKKYMEQTKLTGVLNDGN
jgi:site-specific DNA-methyltransferase (adenine-specific)